MLLEMKKTIFLCLLLVCVSCMNNSSKASNQEGKSEEITKTFEEFGFSVTAPCVFEKLPPVEDGDTTTYVIQGTDGDYPQNATNYLVVVKKTSKVFEDLSEAEQNERMNQIKESDFPQILGYPASYTNVEKVLFSDNKYPGFIGDNSYQGILSRTVEFNKGNYIISLTVMADSKSMNQNELEQIFKKFTDSFKVIE